MVRFSNLSVSETMSLRSTFRGSMISLRENARSCRTRFAPRSPARFISSRSSRRGSSLFVLEVQGLPVDLNLEEAAILGDVPPRAGVLADGFLSLREEVEEG